MLQLLMPCSKIINLEYLKIVKQNQAMLFRLNIFATNFQPEAAMTQPKSHILFVHTLIAALQMIDASKTLFAQFV